MTVSMNEIWQTNQPVAFAKTLASINDEEMMRNFLRDVMTEKEIIEISARLEAARLLNKGEKYITISEKTKLSSRTIARISDWLQNGSNGYLPAIEIANVHHDHLPPAHAK